MSIVALHQIRGVIPAMLTPFGDDEALDLNRVRALARHLCQYDIGGLYLTGSTGEGFMMDEDERMAVVDAVMDGVGGDVPVIVHVGAISTRASVNLARHAARAGASAISSVPPIYWKFTDSSVERYYADLAQACGIPVVVYNIALAGLVSFEMILRLGRIEGVSGIKYTASTQYDYPRIKEALGNEFVVYSGSDEMALSGLSFGADGIIGSTYNALAPLFIRLWQAVQRGDLPAAQRAQALANRVIFTMLQYDLMPVLKLALGWAGVPVGPARRPFTHYSAQQQAQIKAAFTDLARDMDVSDIPFLQALLDQ